MPAPPTQMVDPGDRGVAKATRAGEVQAGTAWVRLMRFIRNVGSARWPDCLQGSVVLLGGWLFAVPAAAEVRLSEFMAASNDRLLSADSRGRWRPGSGAHWTDPGFVRPGWKRGAAPLGFGGGAGLGTNVGALMRNRAPGLYVRRSFELSSEQAAGLGRLRLQVRFDDGFVAWVNGREAGRANAGPPGHFIFHDQPAYNFAVGVDDPRYSPRQQPGSGGAQPMVIDLGLAREWLREGENVLALHLLNREPDVSARIDASLEVVAGAATLTLLGDGFEEANGARLDLRSQGGASEVLVTGEVPPGSWLAAAPTPVATSAEPEFRLSQLVDPTAGVRGTGALRVTHEQSPGAAATAVWFGPGVERPAELGEVAWTAGDLAAMSLRFKFRASSQSLYAVRLDAVPGDPAGALVGLPQLTATAGTAAAETPPDAFEDAVGGARSLTVNAQGAATGAIVGTVRNSYTLSAGPAMRDFAFRVVEDPTVGGGTGAGHLRCEVTRAAAVPDSFGFTIQTFPVRSWTAKSVTADQLAAAVLQVDARLGDGVPLRVWLEPASVGAGAAQRLDLGVITGNGEWQRMFLDPSTGSNQAAFLAALNIQPTPLVRIAFRSEAALPPGVAWELDTIGFVPWRSYVAPLASVSNADAFLAAVNALAVPRFFPAWEKSGVAVSPDRADLVIDDVSLVLELPNAGTPRLLVPWGDAGWEYWPGLAEPSGGLVEPSDFQVPGAEPGFADWIEVENSGPAEVSLTGWSLTTNREVPRDWVFPAGSVVPAGGRLVVLADGRESQPSGASWLHAGITLPSGGGYLALHDASGVLRDGFDPGYPAQDARHSFGRNTQGVWGYLAEASPGGPNDGAWQSGQTAPVVIAPAGGFHSGTVTTTLTCATPDARIRYTLDGSEPTLENGFAYTGPLTLNAVTDKSGHPVRARAFADGLVASAVATQTYLIDQHPGLRSAPAVVLTGDAGRTFYRPTGVLAVEGGAYVQEEWVARGPGDYHLPLSHGRRLDADAPQRPYERLARLEFFPIDGQPAFGEDIGLRVASSPYSRPRLTLNQAASASPWPSDPTEKPSFNIFFRDDYGAAAVNYPFIAESPVRRFEELRLRAGKNDIRNPFIRDEFIRRLFADMGQVSSVGSFNGLWINGVYKGYFNLCERIREPFLQSHHPGSGEWDVDVIFQFEDGDSEHFGTVLYNRLTADLTVRANYEALSAVFDPVNAADYYLLMVYSAMWDWPDNNWVMARERSEAGRWRCYVWDAEGGFGLNGYKPASWNSFAQDLLPQDFWICFQFQRLMTSPEWRLLFADRIQRHFFNGGPLTDARMTSRKEATAAELQPFLAHAGVTTDTAWFTGWLNATSGRKRHLFPRLQPGQAGYTPGHFRDPDGNGSLTDSLWPLTPAPTLSLAPGPVPAGATVTLSLAPGAAAGSEIWYTLDGADPRVWGGGVAAGALAADGPIALAASSVTLSARVRSTETGEWSPLTVAVYHVGTVPATAQNLVVSEIMYHPPAPSAGETEDGFSDAEDFEFIALLAVGPTPVDLADVRFTEGITFDFSRATRSVVDPGRSVLLVRNRAAFARRYGAGAMSHVVGEYFGGLANGGEPLRIESAAGSVIKAFAYGDDVPWPTAADGAGSSLLLVSPAANPDPSVPSSWAASAGFGGQPGGDPWVLDYADWAERTLPGSLLGNPELAGPEADADADGWANGLEFLLLSSAADGSRFPAVDWRRVDGPTGSRLEVSVRVAPGATGVTVVPEGTASLAGGGWRADFTVAPDQRDLDGAVRKFWYRDVPAGAVAWYGRLRLAADSP